MMTNRIIGFDRIGGKKTPNNPISIKSQNSYNNKPRRTEEVYDFGKLFEWVAFD